MSAADRTLEERVAHLERNSETEATLASAVDRLAKEAVNLGAILKRVDEQQHGLAELGLELKAFKELAATTEDVEARELVQHAARRRIVIRVLATIAVIGATLAAVLAYTTNQGYHACQKGQRRVDVQQSFYQSVADQIPRNGQSNTFRDSIDAAIVELEMTRDDCGKAYPVHWGSD